MRPADRGFWGDLKAWREWCPSGRRDALWAMTIGEACFRIRYRYMEWQHDRRKRGAK